MPCLLGVAAGVAAAVGGCSRLSSCCSSAGAPEGQDGTASKRA